MSLTAYSKVVVTLCRILLGLAGAAGVGILVASLAGAILHLNWGFTWFNVVEAGLILLFVLGIYTFFEFTVRLLQRTQPLPPGRRGKGRPRAGRPSA